MKLRKLFFGFTVFIVLALVTFIPASITSANSAKPPDLTVIVDLAPGDLKLFLREKDESIDNAVEMTKSRTAWETYFKLYYWSSSVYSRSGSVLVVNTGGRSFECALPESVTGSYYSVVKLNIASEDISDGNSPARVWLLISLRVLLTLVIEGLVFFAFGYRKKASWICFVIINLLTQGWLNKMICGGPNYTYQAEMTLIFIEPVIFIAEMIFFTFVLAVIIKEQRVGKALAYAFLANLASLFLGGVMLSVLPI
ncbi:MAG: hypothetical protein FWC55_02090 [Firmicutes bacterium]|nr:hypothetical protein [Bacillota bacterium]